MQSESKERKLLRRWLKLLLIFEKNENANIEQEGQQLTKEIKAVLARKPKQPKVKFVPIEK